MCLLAVRVIPNASCTRIVSFSGEVLKIKVMSPADDNRANEALLKFFVELLHVKPIKIHSGARSKNKIIDFGSQLSRDEVIDKLLSSTTRHAKSQKQRTRKCIAG